MNSVRRQFNSTLGAVGAVAVCAGMVTAPVHQPAPIVARELPVVLQALTINDIITRVTDAVTYGLAVAPAWYLGLPISIPMSIGIGFGLADLIPVVGEAFGLTWALDQVARTVVGLGLAVVVYAVGPPFMAVSSLLGITYPSVLPAAARTPGSTGTSPRSAAAVTAPVAGSTPLVRRQIHRSADASVVTPVRPAAHAGAARAGKSPAAAASRPHAKRQAQ
ncbi:MAG: hypothetical protein ACOYBX_07085 [Mycobacterium sp.]